MTTDDEVTIALFATVILLELLTLATAAIVKHPEWFA